MREGTILLLLALVALLSVLLPRIIDAYRRSHWKRIAARIEASYYEVHGKNVYALVDVSWNDAGEQQTATRIPTGKLDIVETPVGSTIFILFDPSRPTRCVVDQG